jgi:hypothetical protein
VDIIVTTTCTNVHAIERVYYYVVLYTSLLQYAAAWVNGNGSELLYWRERQYYMYWLVQLFNSKWVLKST